MIDLHTHILAGMDDGSGSTSESMTMVSDFIAHGYQTVAATPHMVPGTTWMPTAERITKQVADLNRTIQDQGLDLTVVTGMEIALDSQIPRLIENGQLLPLDGGSYFLIEPPFQQLPPGWEQPIFSIRAKGYSVLLAHPERCMQLGLDMTLIDRLIKSGVYLQVNWGSLSGQYGRAVSRTAWTMIQNGWVHCLATDSHHPGRPDLSQNQATMAELKRRIGKKNFRRITLENPLRVLRGEPLKLLKAITFDEKDRKKKWWRFW